MKGNGTFGSCMIDHCPNPRRARSPICANCSSTISRWIKRPPADILSRQTQLEKWQDRMQYLGTEADTTRRHRNAAKFIEKRRA